jgi:acyl-CoA thioesterase-1
MRICFIGDSFINGTGDDDALGWPGRVVATLRRNGLDITYYNLGIRRDTSADILGRWRAEVERRFQTDSPKRLVFSFGANDCASDEHGNARLPHKVALENTKCILEEAASVAPTIMLGPAPILDDIEADDRVKKLSNAVQSLCTGIGVPFLETFTFVAQCWTWRREAAEGDGTHPNREGYAALAQYIHEWPEFHRWLGGI